MIKFYHDKSDSDFKFYLKIKLLEAPSLSFSNADVCVNVYYMHKLALGGGGGGINNLGENKLKH